MQNVSPGLPQLLKKFFAQSWPMATAVTIACLFIVPAQAGAEQQWLSKLELIAQLKQGDYESLERRLVSIQRAFETNELAEWWVFRAFDAFAYADPAIKGQLDEWARLMPRSYAARLARGIYFAHLAWLSRGEASALNTSQVQFGNTRAFVALARPDFEAALARNRRLFVAYFYEMSLAKLTGDLPALFGAYTAGVEAVPNSEQLHLALLDGLDPKWNGSPELYAALRSWIEKQKSNSALHDKLIRHFDLYAAEEDFWAGRYKQALAIYDRVIKKLDYAYVRYLRARTLEEVGRYNAAQRDLERAHALDPEYDMALLGLASMKNLYEKWSDALPYYDLAIRLDPYNPTLLAERAWSLSKVGRFDESDADYEKALYYGRYDSEVHASRGRSFLRNRKDPRHAAQSFMRSISLAPFELSHWKGYLDALYESPDCDFVPATAMYLELCLRMGKCDRRDAVHLSNLVGNFKRDHSCPQDFDMSHLRHLVPDPPPVTHRSNVRAMEVAGLKLNDTMATVRRAYPGIEIVPTSDPSTTEGSQHNSAWNYVSEDDSLKLRTSFSQSNRLLAATVLKWFVYEGSLDELRDLLIRRHGQPDQIQSGKILNMHYYQDGPGADRAHPLASLAILVTLLDTPAKRCELPKRLRVGSTVAFLSVQLNDFAAAKEDSRLRAAYAPDKIAEIKKRELALFARRRQELNLKMHEPQTIGPYDGCNTPEKSADARRGIGSPTQPTNYDLP